jgi:lipoyl(octanoyl) transferase
MASGLCRVCLLGRVDYGVAWDLQKALAEARAEELIPDTLLLLEHPPTFTLGRRGKEAHLLVPRHTLLEQGVDVYDVDRGGDITFHGPGQLVGYPILDLRGIEGGVSRYLRRMEEALIRSLMNFGIVAERLPGLTGVWIGNDKIAAIGVKINARRITCHGFALNVTTDVSYFQRIVPCGIPDKGITTMARVLGRPLTLTEVAGEVFAAFGRVFDMRMIEVPPASIGASGWR